LSIDSGVSRAARRSAATIKPVVSRFYGHIVRVVARDTVALDVDIENATMAAAPPVHVRFLAVVCLVDRGSIGVSDARQPPTWIVASGSAIPGANIPIDVPIVRSPRVVASHCEYLTLSSGQGSRAHKTAGLYLQTPLVVVLWMAVPVTVPATSET
jgi:hypothetical protein